MADAVDAPAVTPGPSPEEQRLVEALRARDEAAFAELIERYHSSLVRLAMSFVSSRAVAEEVAQEAWVGVLKGIDRFEGRSSLRTWIYRILTNTAKTRAQREARTVPFSSLATGEGPPEPAVELERFTRAGYWISPPDSWPEERLLSAEMRSVVEHAIADLPAAQRAVISLRDVEGWSAEEVRNVLDLSETNQRVLLHRARTK